MKQRMSKRAIFWIYGNFRETTKTWNGIVKHVETQSKKKPEIQVMFGGINPINATAAQRWNTAEDVIFALRNRNFCDDRPRIIKVCGLPESYTELANWFHIINGSNVLVIQSGFGYIKPGSKQWITAKTSKLFKKVKAEGFLIEHLTEAKHDGDATDWVISVAGEFKKEIKKAIAREIVAKTGRNLNMLTNVVGKICSYQKGKEIHVEDVHACCSSNYMPETVWQFLEDLDFRREERALAYLQAFYEEGEAVGESFYGRISKMFGALKQHFQFLMHAKDVCGDRELNAQSVEKVLENFKKITPTKILELQRKEISFEELESRFPNKYINRNIQKDNIRFAFRKRKSEIYLVLLSLYNCIFFCRRDSGDDGCLRLYLDTFALVACGKLTYQQGVQIYGDV